MKDIIYIIPIILITFIPISLWGYFFWYINNDILNKKRFFLWLFAWWLSVIPVLYLWDIAKEFSFYILNIFAQISNFSFINVLLSFLSILIIFSLVPFFLFYSPPYTRQKFFIFLKRLLIFSLFFVVISIIFYLLNSIFNSFGDFTKPLEKNLDITFWDIAFNSLKLVIFYYLIIWVIEELSKFLFFSYDKTLNIFNSKDWIVYAIFVALWFSFIENILFFKSIYENFWFWKELISTYFLRNIFSVFLHILCSSIFAYFFSKMYLKYQDSYNKIYIKTLFIWFLLSFILHWLFDIFLSFSMMFFVFLYIIFWYFYFTYILNTD